MTDRAPARPAGTRLTSTAGARPYTDDVPNKPERSTELRDLDERVSLPEDAEEVLRALLAVNPDDQEANGGAERSDARGSKPPARPGE